MAKRTDEYQIRVSETGATKTEKALGQIESRTSKLTKTILQYGAAYFSARGMYSALTTSIKLFAEQARQEDMLRRRVGGAADALIRQAAAMQQNSIYGDEVIIRVMRLVHDLGAETPEAIQRATQASMELASTLDMDLASAARLVGQAMSGNVATLGRYLPEVRKLTKEEVAAGKAVDLIIEKFGGAAKAEAGTFYGALQQTKNVLGDLGESIGSMLVPFMEDLIKTTKDATKALQGLINTSRLAKTSAKYRDMITSLQEELIHRTAGRIPSFILSDIDSIVRDTTTYTKEYFLENWKAMLFESQSDAMQFWQKLVSARKLRETFAQLSTPGAGGEEKTKGRGGITPRGKGSKESLVSIGGPAMPAQMYQWLQARIEAEQTAAEYAAMQQELAAKQSSEAWFRSTQDRLDAEAAALEQQRQMYMAAIAWQEQFGSQWQSLAQGFADTWAQVWGQIVLQEKNAGKQILAGILGRLGDWAISEGTVMLLSALANAYPSYGASLAGIGPSLALIAAGGVLKAGQALSGGYKGAAMTSGTTLGGGFAPQGGERKVVNVYLYSLEPQDPAEFGKRLRDYQEAAEAAGY